MEEFKNMIHQIGLLYQKLSRRQRLVIAVSIVVVIAFLVFLALYKSSSSAGANSGYAVLVQDIGVGDSAAIVAKLEQNGIPYQLENERTILVPQEHLYQQRMMIASEGLIKDRGTGFELFDNQQFGATSKEMDVKFQRAIEGELARTISALEPVEKAVVHIAFPKESVFTERQVPPTASVTVTLKSKLVRKQIDGIKNIVAAAVPRLTLDNVHIIDQKGTPLDLQENYENELLKEIENFRKARVAELEDKIFKALEPYGEVRGGVNIEVNSTRMESLIELYDPNTVIRSEQSLKEESQGRKAPVIQGVPGAVSNIGPVEGLDGPNGLEWSKKEQITTNNEVSKTTTNIKNQIATIGKVSVGILIPKKYTDSLNERDEIQRTFTNRTQAEIASIEKTVRDIIAFNPVRGDSVSVSEYEQLPKLESKALTIYDKYISPLLPSIKYIIAAILLFVFYKKVIQPFMQKMLTDIAEGEEEFKPEEVSVEEAEDALEKFNKARKRVEEGLGLTDTIDEDSLQYDILIEKLRALVNEKTEEVASVLQSLVESDTPNETKDM